MTKISQESTEKLLYCNKSHTVFEWNGDANQKRVYFDKSWKNPEECYAVNWTTKSSALVRDDYKRCVCEMWGNKK